MLVNPLPDLPSSLKHSPGGAGWWQRGSLDIGIGVCSQGRQQRGHVCLLHPRGPCVSLHMLETINKTLIMRRSKTDRSLDRPLSREAGDRCGTCVPELHFVTPSGFPFLLRPCQGC